MTKNEGLRLEREGPERVTVAGCGLELVVEAEDGGLGVLLG